MPQKYSLVALNPSAAADAENAAPVGRRQSNDDSSDEELVVHEAKSPKPRIRARSRSPPRIRTFRKRRILILGTVLVILLVGSIALLRPKYETWKEEQAELEEQAKEDSKTAPAVNEGVSTPKPVGPVHYIEKAFGNDPHYVSPMGDDDSFLPKVAPYNIYKPKKGVRPRTPLFVGFTRNYKMLEQTVLAYIAAGWPRRDIIVVDNSGTMNANKRKALTKDSNPFFLDYEKLTQRYGVNVLRTPTLLTFAQLQNFYISIATEHEWPFYYWSHQDVALISNEAAKPYKSGYQRVIEDLEVLLKKWKHTAWLKPGKHFKGSQKRDEVAIEKRWNSIMPEGMKATDWGVRFYAYDWLTLVNTQAMERTGGWDIFIPYYIGDCDFYDRVKMAALDISNNTVGKIYDLASQLENLETRLFPEEDEEPKPNSARYKELSNELARMDAYKNDNHRNFWQKEFEGGRGEAWTYDPKGFQRAWWKMAEVGKGVYVSKWGMGGFRECGLTEKGKTLKDIWRED